MSQISNQDPSAAAPWLETLRLMSIGLGPDRAFQSGITSLLRLLKERHGFRRPHLVLYDPETGTLRLSVAEALPKDNHGDYTPGVGITGQVFATGKSAIVEKIKGDPVFMSLLFQRSDEEMEKLSFISVPVLAPSRDGPFSAREVIGTLNADTECAGRTDLEYRRLFLEVMAAFIANEAAHLQKEHGRMFRAGTHGEDVVLSSEGQGSVFVAQSKTMRHILEQASAMSSSSAPLLLCGEPGTGKETLAARIHSAGPRREAPLVICRCASIPQDRMLTELCGFQKGAVLGANHTQKGLFEKANTGTVFLESVEYLSREAQESLLRLIKNKEVLRYGASDALLVDTRVIASTGADLDELARKGLFSAELRERLKVNAVRIPPLRERREDIVPLVEHILSTLSENGEKNVKRISLPALELLTRYFWPGNITELRTCLASASERCENHVIRAGDLSPSLQTAESTSTGTGLPLGDAVARFERELLIDALAKAGGNMLKAARDLQSSYRIVNYKVKKYGIDPRQFTSKGRP